ncbi:HDOD domain-containing protein [Ferribacterium limneticum]|uniref:HDOD domain-containing protein n=1 Tax=Ferribacterium limneticum TaxID=76259 RepID=UPI001CFB8380|nr:HDOD domain-containing protein [Ferribacterium limneticum]UCV27596.1 HDOD domain-containing protein [Ferribacterium limneticum]UCV31513.1 HDOD domain-containing protein [Ferribacterium limneticum]
MLDHPLPDIESWTLLFSNNGLPVLRVTKRRIEEMRADLDRVDARELARLILQDPIMTVRVLAYIQPMHGRALQRDITTIASAVMMAGIEPFFRHFDELFTIEDQLKGAGPQALLGVLQIIRRAQRAADYAQEWAIWRHDINMEEVRIAALLHDLAEILVWCSAPPLGLKILEQQKAHPTMRSADAQKNTLGFTFFEIQLELCRAWHLPELLQRLIDDEHAENPRVKNATLAVRLARHSSHGWNDPALPDDYTDIGQLLNITPEAVRQRLGLEPMPAREADGQDAD